MAIALETVRKCLPAIAILVAGLGACAAKTEPAVDAPTGDLPPQTDPGNDDTDPRQDSGGPGARAVSSSLIIVTWAPNTEKDLAGYKVYRNGTPRPIATVPGKFTRYEDRNVLPATTYSYTLTAFDKAGNESVMTQTFRATTPPENMPVQTLTGDVFPILESQCSSCHAAFADISTAYTELTSMGTGPCVGRRIVIPGNALRSLLFQKITGSHDCGEIPPSLPLPSAEANIIGAWINQGGLDN